MKIFFKTILVELTEILTIKVSMAPEKLRPGIQRGLYIIHSHLSVFRVIYSASFLTLRGYNGKRAWVIIRKHRSG